MRMVVLFLAVTEATPQFRNIYAKNIVCNGAAKAIFVRGLPEMHVKDVVLENIVLQANKGIDMQEASRITIKNVKLISDDTNPVVDVINSDNIRFDSLTYKEDSELL